MGRDQWVGLVFLAAFATACGSESTPDNPVPTAAAEGLAAGASPLVGIQQQKILAGDGAAFDSFGYAVALDGETAIVGSIWDDDKGTDAGSAYVFVRSGNAWTLEQKLTASDGQAIDYFGWSVALAGDTAVVGAYADDDNGADAGSAYVFVRSGGTWTQQQKLTASDGQDGDSFGWSVATSGDTVVVSAYADDDKGDDAGSAYVFVRSGGMWTQQQKLTAGDGAAGDQFGYAVALSGDTAVLSAPYDDDKGVSSGSVYVFARAGSTWTQQQKILANDGSTADEFGNAVALDGDTLLVGSYMDDDKAYGSGTAYVFVRSGNLWPQQKKLTASDGFVNDRFGYAVALHGDMAVVGAPYADTPGTSAGAAYAYVRTGTNWAQLPKLLPSDGAEDQSFGWAVALSGSTAFIGAWGDNQGGTTAGAAYAFVLQGKAGEACSADAGCVSGFCVDGVCCNEACGGGDPSDCEACDTPGNLGTCTPLAAGSVCRNAAGGCDAAEVCDGQSTVCPADTIMAQGDVCRPAAGACDVAETCDGTSLDCPADTLLAAGAACRPAANECDVAESCDGSSAACPGDTSSPDGTPCESGICLGGECQDPNAGTGGAQNGAGGAGGAGGNSDVVYLDPGCGCLVSGAEDRRAEGALWLGLLFGLAVRRRRRG